MTKATIGFIGLGNMGAPMAGHLLLNGRFDSGFALALMRKDVDGVRRLADEVGFDPSVAAAAAEYFRRAMATPLASANHTEVDTLLGEGFARAKESQA